VQEESDEQGSRCGLPKELRPVCVELCEQGVFERSCKVEAGSPPIALPWNDLVNFGICGAGRAHPPF
jgi:hypothetical protein